MNALKEKYTTIQSKIANELGISNALATPRLQKVTINMGWGELKGNDQLQKAVVENLMLVTGQKPVATRSKKSIAGFKLRQGDVVGYKITLRGERMYDFLNRLITYVFPRLRDFQGFSTKGFDRHGNYSFGFRDLTVFPEVPFESAGRTGSMQVTVTTSAKNDAGAEALLRGLGFPFTKEQEGNK